jgi:nucleoid DNA-binding protein
VFYHNFSPRIPKKFLVLSVLKNYTRGMNKDSLINIIAQKQCIKKAETKKIVEAVFEEIQRVISSGEEYHHWGFGKFVLATRKSRKIHNVADGTLKMLPEKKNIKFVPSREFNKFLNYIPKF